MRGRKIRNLIKRQNAEAQQAAWRRIEEALGEDYFAPKPKPKRSPKFWKILSACTSCAVVLILGLGLGLGLGLNRNPDVSQVEPPDNSVQLQYCSADDCDFEDGEYTLKQYAEVYNVELLYLDWYDTTEDYGKSLYTLKDSGAPVCFKEFFMCPDANYISVYITNNRTIMDFLPWFDAETGETTIINGVSVYYKSEAKNRLVNFEYKGYRYYLELDIDDFDYLCQIAEEMLSNT
ncbi:MAG: hypothetical protein K2N84_05300 [Clostridia bacterium]|nr:hypothetical protein [Clostridia bacterium]